MDKLLIFLKGLWAFLNSKIFIVIIFIVLLLIGVGECKRIIDLKQTIDTHTQNIAALTDSLKFEKRKNGALLVSISGYLSTEKELKTINKGLWEKIQGQTGKIISLNTVVAQLQQDSAQLQKNVKDLKSTIGKIKQINDSTYTANWTLTYKYDTTNYDIFSGKTTISVLDKDPLTLRHVNTQLLNRKTQISLIWGQKVEQDKLRVFVQSSYPGFTVTNMSGVLIDSSNPFFKDLVKKKHWFPGWSIGLAITPGWNILDAKYGVVIGPAISWGIYNW